MPHVMKPHPATLLWIAGVFATLSAPAIAADPDNCLYCHQFRGLSRYDADADRVHLYFVDPSYHEQLLGAHARLACTDCHPRNQVAVVPHEPVSKVDCTTTCHLSTESGLSRRFSHANAAQALRDSAHNPETLGNLQFADGPLLEPDQSQCLYCHDEPVFRDDALLGPAQMLGDARCASCHVEQIPIDVAYYIRHVNARLGSARAPLDQAQTCGVCHADAGVLAQHDAPNTITSFVRSFHGKAALLGDNSTADCVACHVAQRQDPHAMRSKLDPLSSVHADNVANTCRSTECHPGADVALSAAGVHLDLPSAHGTIEFFIAAGFIVLTVLTFGPSLVICLMELFQIVIGRHPPQLHYAKQLTAQVLAHPQGRARLQRFTVGQRWQHWILALLFALLAITGFPLKFADTAWAQWCVEAFGGLATTRHLHHWAGVALVLGFVYHMIYAVVKTLGNVRQPGPDGQPQSLLTAFWNMPMLIHPQDVIKMQLLMLYLFGLRKKPPTFGRFTIKEKFEYIGVFWGTILLGVTGALLWGESFFSHYIDGRVLNIALIAHTYEAFLAIIHVGILHIVNVTLSPHVFPLSPATMTGVTPRSELAEQHLDFVEDAARDLGIPTKERQ